MTRGMTLCEFWSSKVQSRLHVPLDGHTESGIGILLIVIIKPF